MELKTFAELTTPDERTLRFAPSGLSLGGLLDPDVAAELQQATIASCDLTEVVPEPVRASFERLRACHARGVVWYDAFTVAADLSHVVLEQALRARFLEYYSGSIPLVDQRDATMSVPIRDFDELERLVRGRGPYGRSRLRVQADESTMQVPTTLRRLMGWARREGLLHGQRNKALEPLISRMRNRFAHGQYWLGTPVESARAIHDVAEVVNRLWGATTPGGRLYPAPLERDVVAIGWLTTKQGLQLTRHNPDQLPSHVREVGDDWTYLIVLAVPDDDLWEFDSVYERTAYPTRLLWGPGSASAAADWYREANIVTDTVDYLDRLFAIRVDGGTTYLPQRPEVVLSLPASRTSGDWHVIRADFPLDAFNHVRSHESEALAVEVIAITDWSGACALLRSAPTFGAHPASGPEARVPERFPLAPEAGHPRSDTQD